MARHQPTQSDPDPDPSPLVASVAPEHEKMTIGNEAPYAETGRSASGCTQPVTGQQAAPPQEHRICESFEPSCQF